MKFSKKQLAFIIPLFAITLISAAYLVSSFVITTDVYEPFTVEYAIIGDASNYDGVTTCDNVSVVYQPATNVDVGGLYAGEGRKICTKITNAGEGDVDYTFSGRIVSGNNNLEECTSAFGNPTVTGTALGSSVTYTGSEVIVADDATPITGCEVTLAVARGI